jgi:hypothetical protein
MRNHVAQSKFWPDSNPDIRKSRVLANGDPGQLTAAAKRILLAELEKLASMSCCRSRFEPQSGGCGVQKRRTRRTESSPGLLLPYLSALGGESG